MGGILKVCFPDAHDQAVGERKLSKCLSDLGAEKLCSLRMSDIAEGLSDAMFFDQTLGKQHQIRLGKYGDALFLTGFLQDMNLVRFTVHPLTLLGAFRQNLRVDGFPVDGQRRRVEQKVDFAVVS